ncbi:MAG: hypothetical protein QM706_02335 [Nitrospira sp.]
MPLFTPSSGNDENEHTTEHPVHGDDANRNLEVELLLAGIQKRYGYDFTHYSHASLMRRLEKARVQAHVT